MKIFCKINFIFFPLFLLTFLTSLTSFAANVNPLRPEQAFVLSSQIKKPNIVVMSFDIAPNYYLYAERLKFASHNGSLTANMPPAPILKGIGDKPESLYTGLLKVTLTFNDITSHAPFEVNYQGCAKTGFCYPPIKKFFDVNFKTMQLIELSNVDASSQDPWDFKNWITDQERIRRILSS